MTGVSSTYSSPERLILVRNVTTTAIFAEILMIGLFTAAGIAVVVGSILSWRLGQLVQLRDWIVPLTLLLVAVAYPLGIAVDRLADTLASQVESRWLAPEHAKKEPEMRFRVWDVASSRAIEFFDYARSRRRITRACCVVALATGVIVLALIPRAGHINIPIGLAILALGFSCGWAWWEIGAMYYKRLAAEHDRTGGD